MGKILIDGEYVDEIDEKALKEKLLKNIEYIKMFDNNFSVSKDEINAAFSSERKNFYYKMQALNSKLNRSESESKEIHLAGSIDRAYAFTRFLDNTKEAKEANKIRDEKIKAHTLEGDLERKKLIVEYLNKCKNLDPKMLDINTFIEGLHRQLDPNYKKDEPFAGPTPSEMIDYYIKNADAIDFCVTLGAFKNDSNLLGFDLKKDIKQRSENLFKKAEYVGGCGRLIRRLLGSETFFTIPGEKLGVDLAQNILLNNIEVLPNDTAAVNFTKEAMNPISLYKYLDMQKYQEPEDIEYTLDDLENTRMSFQELKKVLSENHKKLCELRSDSKLSKSDKYNDLVNATENALFSLSGFGREVSPEQTTELWNNLRKIYDSVLKIENPGVTDLKPAVKEKLLEVSENLKSAAENLSTAAMVTDVAADDWNKNDSKNIVNVYELKHRPEKTPGLDHYNSETIFGDGKSVSWERVSPEKNMSGIQSYSMALGVLKHLKAELESTDMKYKKNSQQLRDMYATLGNVISELDGKDFQGDEMKALWNTKMKALQEKILAYVDGKNERIARFGTNGRSVKRYELAMDILKLTDKAGELQYVPADQSQKFIKYKTEAARFLNRCDVDMKSLEASGDSKEFRRLQEQVRFAKAVLESATSQKEAGRVLQQIRNAAADYYIAKADQTMRGTRPAKLKIARKLFETFASEDSSDFKVDLSARKMLRLQIAAKITKQMSLTMLNSRENAKQQEAKKLLKNPAALMRAGNTLANSDEFDRQFGDFDKDALEELNKKSAKDLYKQYLSNIPKIYTGRSIDAKMEKINALNGLLKKQIDIVPYHTQEEGDTLKGNNKYGFTTDRGALRSLAIGLMLKDGFNIDDVFDVSKFKNEKWAYGRRAIELIRNEKSNDIADAYIVGINSLSEYVNQKFAGMNELTVKEVMKDEYKNILSVSMVLKDMTQEVTKDKLISDLNPKEDYKERISGCARVSDAINKFGGEIEVIIRGMNDAYSHRRQSILTRKNCIVTSLVCQKNLSDEFNFIKQEMKKSGKTFTDIAGTSLHKNSDMTSLARIMNFKMAADSSIVDGSMVFENQLKHNPDLGDKILESSIDGAWKNIKINWSQKVGSRGGTYSVCTVEGLEPILEGKVKGNISAENNLENNNSIQNNVVMNK